MATVNIFPNQVTSYDLCGPYNGTGAGILGDSNSTTGWAAVYGTSPAFVAVHRDSGMPADFVGATINTVYIQRVITSNLQRGTANISVVRAGQTTTLATLGPGFSPGFQSVTRPGGGSWVYTDFYVPSLYWRWSWHGNADDPSKTSLLEELYMIVDYTPVSGPTAEFTVSTTTGTSPLTVNFTDQSTNTPTGWLWAFGDTNTSTLQNPSHIYSTTATSTYTVTLTASNAGGTDTETKSSLITVDPAVSAVAANFIASPLSGVQDLEVRFTDQSTGTPAPASWLWSFGDTATSTEQNPIHTYTTVGTYTVILTVENTTPTTDTETKTNYITVANGKPVPAITVSTTTGTRPLEVDFTGSATNALPTSWEWDFGDGTGSVAQSPTHVYTTVGTFSPSLTVGNAVGTASTTVMTLFGTSDTYTQLVVGFATITASFTAAPLMGYIPFTVRFRDQSTGDANSWRWDFGDGGTSDLQHPVHTFFTNSTEAATVTVTETGFADDYALRFGLTNYWKMEESTGTGDRVDSIGGSDLSTGGTSVAQITGKNDFGAELFGTPEFIRRTTDFSHTDPWSYSGWFYLSTLDSAVLDWFGTQGGSTVARVDNDGSVLRINNSGSTSVSGTTTLTAATWYHLVFTFDGVSVYKLYLNGVLEATLTGGAAADGSGFLIQNGSALGSLRVDEVGRYDHELENWQIEGLYNEGLGEFFDALTINDSLSLGTICPIHPDPTWGYFFEELKFMLMEHNHEVDVCTGFDRFGGIDKMVELTQRRLHRFVLETAALRKEATLASADSETENFALPTDVIELLRVEVDGTPYYPADPYQRDMDSGYVNSYFQQDALSITIPGTFGTTPVVKAYYTYVPTAPARPAPCTCPEYPDSGPWAAFPLPYVLWWVIRYGVMADAFSQAGERNDPLRAGKCEELFNLGVQIYKTLYRGEG